MLLEAGEKHVDCWSELKPVKIQIQLFGSIQASIGLILFHLKACDLFHPSPHVSHIILLELSFQLFFCIPYILPSSFSTVFKQSSVFLPEGFLLALQQLFQVTGDPGFVTGETPYCPCRNNTFHTEVYVIFHTLSPGTDIILQFIFSLLRKSFQSLYSDRLLLNNGCVAGG